MMNYIYTLTDPRDNLIKYIGKTNNIDKRLSKHLVDKSNSKKGNWIKKLKSLNLKPIIEVIDMCDIDDVNNLEIYWISQFITWGFNLKNFSNGGDGGWYNKKHTEISKEKMRNNNPNMKSVVLFDINMRPLKKFKSLRDASRETMLERPFILRSCTKNTTACGCYFKHSKIEFDEDPNWKSFIIKREYGNFIKTYDKEEWIKIVKSSTSYKEVSTKIGLDIVDGRVDNKIYRLIKKFEIDTSHFKRKKREKYERL